MFGKSVEGVFAFKRTCLLYDTVVTESLPVLYIPTVQQYLNSFNGRQTYLLEWESFVWLFDSPEVGPIPSQSLGDFVDLASRLKERTFAGK